jgi:phosphoribosylamine--glycine ligase
MNVLVIGQGGREHAIIKALVQSATSQQVFAMPGSDGIAKSAICLEDLTNNPELLLKELKKKAIELVIVGPEVPLVAGLATQLRKSGVHVFGPSIEAAQLEGSKIFAKDFMIANSIPTADADIVTSVSEVKANLKKFKTPYVLKADGLAAGKGVFISDSEAEILKAAEDIFDKKTLGTAGDKAILEQPLMGYELSAFVLVGDNGYSLLPFFRDHKRLNDKNLGPNTGGMGVIGPIDVDQKLLNKIIERVIEPSVQGLKKNNWTYRGLLYVGIMVVDNDPYVLEYNVRFGDPEAQCILPLLDGDWADVFLATAKGETKNLDWKNLYTCCVVVAAPGYPENPIKGEKIIGDLNRGTKEGYLLHAGTKKKDSYWVSNGGRVLNAIGIANTQQEAVTNAYKLVDDIHWPTKVFRRDIGK